MTREIGCSLAPNHLPDFIILVEKLNEQHCIQQEINSTIIKHALCKLCIEYGSQLTGYIS